MDEPFEFDWKTAVPTNKEPEPASPSTPTPPESISAVMSGTRFGAQNMPLPEQGPVDTYPEFDWKTAQPQDGGFDASTARESTPAENAELYDTLSNPAYLPTKGEFQWYEGYKKTRDDKVSRFVQGATGMAGGLVQAAAATAYAPFDLLVRGTPAWNEWVNSSAEGLRQTSIGLAELWSWGGDIYADNQKELQRSRDLNNQIRQQLAAENKFTGNAQQDEQTLQQAIEQAKAGGLYEKTADDLNADEDTRFERFIRDRSFQQQSANITETNIGTLPDSQREMGIDPSKVNPGLAFTAQLVFDPLNAVVPGGIGALSNLRLMRRTAALTGAPLKGLSKVAKASADKVEDLYGGILSGIESRTGLNEAAAMGALNNPVTWRAVAAMAALKTTGKVLRKSENWLETGSIIAKEASVGGVGISRADAAARLRNAPIPERYRRAYDGFFTSADSTLRRVSETPGLSPIARRSAATLDRAGVTQAFRLADDAVSGAAAVAPIGIPFAAIAPEDRQPEILGALLSIGAMGGVVGGQARRMSQMNDALVAKMLADAEISGGDAVAMANMLSPEKLADMARKQTMISAKADWVPLRAVDYELNKTVQEAVGNGTKGIYIEASAGKRPRVFLNLDKLASGDVAGHEIGHAIFMSDIMGGEIKQGMRAMVDVEYGADGLAARGREYAKAQLTQEVNQGATGIKLEVLTPEEVNRKAAGVSEADLIRDRWSNDSAWRDSAINDRIDLMNQERIARGGQPLDWARDEIAAETFSGLGKGVNLNGLRASGPLGRAVGAAQTALDMMGARFRGNGRLESPNKLFTENPLFDSPQMRKAVNDYVKMYDRYLVGLEKEGKIRQRGTPIAPTGRASDAARSPHTRLYPNKGVVESDLFVQRPDGTLELKSQQMVNTQDKARAATLKSINSRDRLVPENSQEWGARRLSNGRVVVGGPTLPPQFDFFLQMPEWLRFKAREFEAGRNEGRSYLYSYNAIGTGADGSYKVKNLGNVEAKTGEAVPFGWDLSQKNHLLAKVIDLNSFRASSMRAIDNQLLGEFGNDLKAVEAGLKQLLKNYQDGVPGETNLGVTKKNILNGLLGTGTPTQRANNPAWHTLNNQGSIRTFRFDRLNYADPYGTGYFPHYDKLNINALPDNAGRMSLDEYMSFDADRQTAWLNNRARERGHSNSTNWQNSDEAGFAAAAEEYRKLFPRADAPMARGNAMPDAAPVRTLDTDRLLREYEENQGYLGLSTMGMREGRPVKGGAAETRRLLARNTEISRELDARGVKTEDAQLQRALAKRQTGQAMPDVPEQIFGEPTESDGAFRDWRLTPDLNVSFNGERGTYFVNAGEQEFGPYRTAQDAAEGLLKIGQEVADVARPQIERDAMRDSLSGAKTLRGEDGVAGVSFSRIKGSSKSNSMYMDVVIDFDPALGKRLYNAGVQDKRDTGNFAWDLDDDAGVVERATVSARISDHADVSAFSKSTAAIQDFVRPSRRGDWLQAPDRVLADIEQRIGVSLPRPKIQKPDVSIGPLEAVASRLAAVRSKQGQATTQPAGVNRKTRGQAMPDVADIDSSTSVSALQKHPMFKSAKYDGSAKAAFDIVESLVKPKAIQDVMSKIDPSRPAYIIPVIAREGDSANMLPLAMAEKLSAATGIPIWAKLAKTSSQHNTGAGADSRARTAHRWEGEPPPAGSQIVLVDDTYTTGQTLRSLASVVGDPDAVATISVGRYTKQFTLQPDREQKLLAKAGLTKQQFINLYGSEPKQALTGAQAQQYLLNGARGEQGLLARFPVERGGFSTQAIAGLTQLPEGVTTFSGGGLVEIGLRGIVRPTVAVEYSPAIAQAYRAAHGDHVKVQDIRTVSLEDHKGKFHYHASPVCKNSSLLKSAALGGGEKDLDIESAQAVARHIDQIEPKVVTIENVPDYAKTEAADIIRKKLQERGYTVDENVYNAAKFGAPTARRRYLLRAVKDGVLPEPVPQDGPGWYSTVADMIDTLPDDSIARAQYIYRSLREQGVDPDNVTEPLLVSGTTLFKKVAFARPDQPAFTFKATPATVDRILLPGGRVKRVTARAKARMTGIQ
jgi:site-specific DNA-cytosine methylase